MSDQRLRNGQDFLSDLRKRPRAVYVDGERVSNAADHPAFRGGARALAGLFDFAAAPEHREAMTFPSPEGGAPVWRCWQIPRTHAELRAKRIAAEKWAELSFGLMGRTPDHVANFFAGYAAKPSVFSASTRRTCSDSIAKRATRTRTSATRSYRRRSIAPSRRTSRPTRRCTPAW